MANDIPFRLFAPYNETVALIGNWNNWQPILMNKDDRGYWHVNVPLEDGDYYYKFTTKSNSYFMLGQTATFYDPCAPAVTRDAEENAILKVRHGQPVVHEYQWRHDDKPLPQNHELVIYELHVGDFSGGPGDDQHGTKGRFQDVIDKLDYLTSLGINAIELMPCNEFPFERSWGYNPRSIFAVENNYGTPEDFCHLVDECHARGIRVIHDGVYNHSEENSPLTRIDFDYWYYHENPDEPYNRFGPKFNYEHFDTNLNIFPARQHVLEAILFWTEYFHIDGIRFDATYLIRHFEFLGWIHDEIFKRINFKPFYTIAENIPQDPTITGPEGPLDAAWHENFAQQLMAAVTGQSLFGREPYSIDGLMSVLDARQDGFESAMRVINYLVNHDHDRLMWQISKAGFFDDVAFRRDKLGATLLFAASGVPMIYMGQEFGESAAKTTDWQRIDWSLLANERNRDLQQYYAGLIKLRKEFEALHTSNIELIDRDDERGIFAFKRWNDSGSLLVVVANLQDDFVGPIQMNNWPSDGRWHEYIHNYDLDVSGGVLNDQLAESEVKIYYKIG